MVNVAVTYAGVPSSVRLPSVKRSPWWRTRDGAIGAGAPENAWWWFPSNDHPLDKATFSVSVTVPNGISVISNGVQPTPPTAADAGWTTWAWRSSKPQQPYLALLVIGEYELVQTTSPSGLPVTLAYSKRLDVSAARPSLERTAEIVRWEESVFGPYPFEALGGVIAPSDGINYALENQTRPIYPLNYFTGQAGGRSGDSVVAHENAHQWFGDSVAVGRWRDVWLSEGFATYAEWLWSESQGDGTAQAIFDTSYARYPASSDFWQVVIGDPGKARIYDQAVYNRGAMALHQLRLAMGDAKFFEILKTWSSTRRHANGTIDDFMALASMISGQNLDALFKAWLFTPERPAVAP
jgi:aminopeptidase N